MGCCIKVLKGCSMFCQVLTFHVRILTKIKVIAFDFWYEFFIRSWSVWIFLSISNLKLCFSCKSSSSYIKWWFETFIINRLSWLMTSRFNWFAGSIICCMILIRVISKNKVRFLKVFVLFFIWNLFFIICSSWNALFNHWMLPELKVSLSKLS